MIELVTFARSVGAHGHQKASSLPDDYIAPTQRLGGLAPAHPIIFTTDCIYMYVYVLERITVALLVMFPIISSLPHSAVLFHAEPVGDRLS